MTLAGAASRCEFLVVVDYWMTPTALFADYVFPAAGALERPTIVTHYGATDSIMGGRRAISPSTTATPTRRSGASWAWPAVRIREDWPWETEEDAYFHIL